MPVNRTAQFLLQVGGLPAAPARLRPLSERGVWQNWRYPRHAERKPGITRGSEKEPTLDSIREINSTPGQPGLNVHCTQGQAYRGNRIRLTIAYAFGKTEGAVHAAALLFSLRHLLQKFLSVVCW